MIHKTADLLGSS